MQQQAFFEPSAGERLSAELEAALLRELRQVYDWENVARFKLRLRPPTLALVDTTAQLGRWVPELRTIELARAFVLGRPWPEVTSVLLHEMAHQLVDEVLQIASETAHGETFRKVCAQLGIDARAAGAPVAATGLTRDVDRILERIRKLLALAGSSNEHEAALAMRKAHELMLRHNVEEAAATAERAFEVRLLGDATRRGTRVEAEVITLLAEFFFVASIRLPVYLPRTGKRGNVYEITGTRANLEMAEHVYAFLLATAERLWQAHLRSGHVHDKRDRLSYQSGVIRGFADKLRDERRDLRGTGLVWRGDDALLAYYRARNPRVVTRRQTTSLTEAHLAGREAGRKVVLHKPVSPSSSGGSGERRLLRG
jgi:uncharacterized protein DUF2786/SprT-like family protein